MDTYIDRLIRVAQLRYINRDMPVPLTILARLEAAGVYFDILEQE